MALTMVALGNPFINYLVTISIYRFAKRETVAIDKEVWETGSLINCIAINNLLLF